MDEYIECSLCGRYTIGLTLARTIENGTPIESVHIVSGYLREEWDKYRARLLVDHDCDTTPPFLVDREACAAIVDQAPRTVTEKAHKLLKAVERRTDYFGQLVGLDFRTDYPLAYAQNTEEFRSLANYLFERGFITAPAWNSPESTTALTASGLAVFETGSTFSPITVFLSSTCYDLLDLRFELASYLESQGAIVKLSDDWERFDVEGRDNSIDTCLQNLEQSDVVFCILDRRYGGVIPDGTYAGRSATHVELLRAREEMTPVYFFIRDKAELDYRQLRQNADYKPEWVSERDPDKQANWLELVEMAFKLPTEKNYSNWRDQFKTVVDLKRVAAKRLSDYARSQRDH
jgi:hypothetical protein